MEAYLKFFDEWFRKMSISRESVPKEVLEYYDRPDFGEDIYDLLLSIKRICNCSMYTARFFFKEYNIFLRKCL